MDEILDKYKAFLGKIIDEYQSSSKSDTDKKITISDIIDFLDFVKIYKTESKAKIEHYLNETFDTINGDELKAELNRIAVDLYNKVKSGFFEK